MNLPDFDTVNDAVHGFSNEMDAAEIHGQLCGLLCTLNEVALETWLSPTLPGDIDITFWPADRLDLFQSLLDVTQAQLDGPEFEFGLLLPGDDASLPARLETLANWCQGYLLGISYGGVEEIEALPGDLPEFVNDLINLSRTEDYDLENEQEDETAYMELVEYVRVGVQVFYDEMHLGRTDDPSPAPKLH